MEFKDTSTGTTVRAWLQRENGHDIRARNAIRTRTMAKEIWMNFNDPGDPTYRCYNCVQDCTMTVTYL